MPHKREPGCIKMNYGSAPIGAYIDSKSLEHRIAFALCDEVQRIVVSEDIRADAFATWEPEWNPF